MRMAIIKVKDTLRHARRQSAVNCAKMAEPIDLPFGLWTRMSRRKHKVQQYSVCGGDAALCQITLTTCLLFMILQSINQSINNLFRVALVAMPLLGPLWVLQLRNVT